MRGQTTPLHRENTVYRMEVEELSPRKGSTRLGK